MILSFYLAAWQARDALRNGQPDVARRILEPFAQAGYGKALKLNVEVARAYCVRAEQARRHDNPDAAWKDLLAAEGLQTGLAELVEFRRLLTLQGLTACKELLRHGKPLRVVEALARLKQRTAFHREFDFLDEAARDWLLAIEMADRGDFAAASGTLAQARDRTSPELHPAFEFPAADLARRAEQYRAAVERLYDAAEAKRWRAIHEWADAVTAVAPNHRDARILKAKAWEALHPDSAAASPTSDSGASVRAAGPSFTGVTLTRMAYPPKVDSVSASEVSSPGSMTPKRFVLWIDGVGGFLVCMAPRITFGQATALGPVDVPLFADVSRLHAELSRDGEGYVLESAREVMVNGASAKRTILRTGDRVTLGATCQFVFHQPVPISPSARLELVSGHRLPVAVDGILLMAENLILGPGPQAHVLLPEGSGNLVFYRSQEGIGFRCPGEFHIDNRPHRDRAALPVPCHVASEHVSFALEPYGLGKVNPDAK